MKVLQINSVCGFGSTGRIATDLHNGWKKNGYNSYIAYGRGEGLNCDQTIKIGNKIDNYNHVLKTRLLDQHGFGSKQATIEFIEKVKKYDPDIIHLHNIHGYYINVEMLFSYLKEADKTVIWTLHDCWSFTGHCTNFEYSGCECWKPNGDHHCIQKKSYPASWFVNNSKRNFERKNKAFIGVKKLTVVTPSKWLADLVEESFLQEYPVKVINNGIDLDVFKPSESKFKDENLIANKFVILGVASSWGKRKGFKYFIELSEHIDPKEVIVLVGLSEGQIKKLPPNIIGISRTNNIQELAKIYSAANVFVNPTLEDNFPTTNLESLATGTPVITFDTGGSPEAIDKLTGIVTEEKTTFSILKAIDDLKNDPINREDCRKRAEFFNKKIMVEQYNHLLKEMKNSKRG